MCGWRDRKHPVLAPILLFYFYKTLGYACLFKGYGTNVNQIPTNELTISIFYEAYPRKMLLIIEMEGHTIEEKYPGIYYVYDFPFPVQIVVIKQLRSGEHKSLKVLSLNADRDDIKAFLKETEDLYSLREKQNVDAVMRLRKGESKEQLLSSGVDEDTIELAFTIK